jgi:hypothetical protein
MKKETILTITYKNKVTIDCFGCDYEETEFIPLGLRDRLKSIKTLLSYKPEYCVHRCKALSIELSEKQLNVYDMTKEECPCHFEKWQQTNSDLADFIEVPTYQFNLIDGKIIQTITSSTSSGEEK